MKAANKAGTRRDFLPAGNTKIKKLWGDRIFDNCQCFNNDSDMHGNRLSTVLCFWLRH